MRTSWPVISRASPRSQPTRSMATWLFTCRQVRRFHAQHGRLQGVDPEVAADEPMVVLPLGAMRPQQSQAVREGIV